MHRLAASAVCAFAVLCLSACSSHADDAAQPAAEQPDGSAGSADAAPADAAPPDGCTRPPLGAGDYTRTLSVGGLTRTYYLHVPPGLTPGHPTPVVLAFHGGGQTASALEAMAHLQPKADAASFVLVEAEGTGALGPGTSGSIDAWNAGNCCAYPSEKDIDDVAFVRATSDDVATQVCVDPQRVFATGFSNGAMLAHRLACELSDRIAAIAAVSGGMGEENLAVTPPEAIFTCDPPRPVPVLHIHGTQDVCYPFDGGASPLIGATTFEPVMTTIDGWVARNGCSQTTKTVLTNGRATCKDYACPAGGAGDVELCTIQGGGHYWPGGSDWPGSETLCGMGQGVLTSDLDANDALWAWFVAHPMPTP